MPFSSAESAKARQLLIDLLSQLETISGRHEELFDSDVRDAMAIAIFHGFLRPTPGYSMPEAFGLYSGDGNQQVRTALNCYVEKGNALTHGASVNFQDRLAAFQDPSVKIGQHDRSYSSYLGHFFSESFDSHGNPIKQ